MVAFDQIINRPSGYEDEDCYSEQLAFATKDKNIPYLKQYINRLQVKMVLLIFFSRLRVCMDDITSSVATD